jgi:hypothetical protein
MRKGSSNVHTSSMKNTSGTGKNGLRFSFFGLGCILYSCLMLLSASTARAEANLHIGQLKFDPYLSVSDTFSDNIYFTPENPLDPPKRDSYMTYTPGIRLRLPFGRDRFEAEYFARATRYDTYKGEDTTDHNASGSLDIKVGRPFGVLVSEHFIKGHEDRSTSATGFIETYRNNTATAALTYHLATRSKIEFDASKSTWDYIQSPFRNRDDYPLSGYLYYRFLPKTSVFVEYDRTKSDYEYSNSAGQAAGLYQDLNNLQQSGQIGLTWEISEKSKGTIKGGVVKKNFESYQIQDYSGATWSVDINHDFSQTASLKLLGLRAPKEANVEGTSYYITTGGFGELSFHILTKLSVVAHGSWGKDTFSNIIPGESVPRIDRTTQSGGGLKYAIGRWGEIGFDYNHRQRHSTIPTYDYDEHSYLVSASVVL